MLCGKGLWAYRIGELDRAIALAPRMGATHILYKVAQGSSYYLGSVQAAQKITAAGLIPFAWTFMLLENPQAEAANVVNAFRDGYQGFVFDTEAAVLRYRFRQATELGERVIAAGVDTLKLYNCSYPNISHHRSLPYDQMNKFCRGGLMPMSYGSFFSPSSTVPHEEQAARVIDEWTYGHHEYWAGRWGYTPPIHPILAPYHDEYGRVRMSPEEFQIWLDRLQAHAPSFLSVFTAAVVNENLLPGLKSFQLGVTTPETPVLGLEVEVDVSPDSQHLNVRSTPSTALPAIGRVPHGAVLHSLESDASTRRKVGQDGEWLMVRLPDGGQGYVAAWYLHLRETVEVGLQVEVVSPTVGYLVVHPTPSTDQPAVTQVDDGVVLEALEPAADVEAKVGVAGQWLRVKTPDGVEGYAPAELLALVDTPFTHLVVQSAAGLNIRRADNGQGDVIWHVGDATIIEPLEAVEQAQDKIGKDRWIRVRTPSRHEGYVNGLYVARQRLPDVRQPVEDSELPYGECAWLFGFHAAGATSPADFRYLFQGKDKTGWVCFTESIGADPSHGGGQDYSPWSYNGYGVLVRLNNSYHDSGTLPVRTRYADFARSCAAYVQKSRGCHIWIIGNEPNNVREHPGGYRRPIEHITPEMYAEAFNLARRRIKEAHPDARVVPGAVDPYFALSLPLTGQRYRPLDYFRQMLSYIEDLDGFCLHTYTHWLDIDLITRLTVFQDQFLRPGTRHEHYYDFQAYRPFVEAIPAKWRDRPIYITETNHWVASEQPWWPGASLELGWVNVNKGWVGAAYKEIQRWNSTPHAQQIHCLLLYRWSGDEWALHNKQQVLEDFSAVLGNDFRWRR
ncbi:MAG: SH3 domain-containing protein [Anaerolineales bacterium]|nr:SH3 domain-containing protein [Anaerolineales bacterium]